MSKYTGSKCLCCGVPFFEGDDVVVCPDCGTPYHRECYLREGKCINDTLHADGGTWQPDIDTISPEETVKCVRCGADNPKDKPFCEVCGAPMMRPDGSFDPMGGVPGASPIEERLVFNQDSVVDGVRLGDYAIYIGKNPLRFLPSFIKFSKFKQFGAKISLNFMAFLVPSLYLLYRKIKPWGILILVLSAILGIPDMIYYLANNTTGINIDLGIDLKSQLFVYLYNSASIANMILQITAGIFANYLYYKQARRDIMAIRGDEGPEEDTRLRIAIKGGVSWANVVMGFTIHMAITMGAIVLIGKLM